MLTSTMTGNLGNHMFIYALTRTVAEANGYEWGFNPVTEYDYHQGKPQMAFMEIDYGKTHNYKYNETPPWIEHEWREDFKRYALYEPGSTLRIEEFNFYYFQPDNLDKIKDNTKLYISCAQDARYYNRDKLRKWFKIKGESKGVYLATLREFGIPIMNEDVCVINIRGGEYKGVPNLILRKEYWQDAIRIMKDKNPKMRFVCITDDVPYANNILDFKVPVVHISIGGDYYIINNAKNLILSNSSFAIFPTWLNENEPFVIAPRGWARHNVSDKHWVSSDIWTFGWNFLDKEGILDGGI